MFGKIERLKTKDEMLEDEFGVFIARYPPEDAAKVPAIKTLFKAYAADAEIRNIIDARDLPMLATNAGFSLADYRGVPEKYRRSVPEYVKDYVSLNQFV